VLIISENEWRTHARSAPSFEAAAARHNGVATFAEAGVSGKAMTQVSRGEFKLPEDDAQNPNPSADLILAGSATLQSRTPSHEEPVQNTLAILLARPMLRHRNARAEQPCIAERHALGSRSGESANEILAGQPAS